MNHQDTLYIILVAQGRVVTLVRPKKHSIHPTGWCPVMFHALRLMNFSTRHPHHCQHDSLPLYIQFPRGSLVDPCMPPQVQSHRLCKCLCNILTQT